MIFNEKKMQNVMRNVIFVKMNWNVQSVKITRMELLQMGNARVLLDFLWIK